MGAAAASYNARDWQIRRIYSYTELEKTYAALRGSRKQAQSQTTLRTWERLFSESQNEEESAAREASTSSGDTEEYVWSSQKASPALLHAAPRPKNKALNTYSKALRLKLQKMSKLYKVKSQEMDTERYDLMLHSQASDRPESHLITLCSRAIEGSLQGSKKAISSILEDIKLPSRLAE